MSGFALAQDSFEITPVDTVTVVFYVVGDEAADPIATALADDELQAGATSELLLRSQEGDTLVHLIKWQAEEPAQSYRARYFPLAEAYWRREFQLKSAEAQEGEGWSITPDASVQWSEFLMRDPSLTEELSETVGGMVMGMTMGGAETLLSAQTFTSTNGLSVGILARWAEPDGFKVFVKDDVFGDDPYWHDYADNAHWMMTVIAIK